MSNPKVKAQKELIRGEAKRARGLLSMGVNEQRALCSNFFDNIEITKDSVVAAYLPIDRELDTNMLIDELWCRGANVVLPVVQEGSHILKFARFDDRSKLEKGKFGTIQPIIKQYLSPNIFIVPLLAFDRKGNRLGFGGGYYDATLAHYKKNKDIIAIGLGYAEQACLFNLPAEDHDVKMDWIITQQGAHSFKD